MGTKIKLVDSAYHQLCFHHNGLPMGTDHKFFHVGPTCRNLQRLNSHFLAKWVGGVYLGVGGAMSALLPNTPEGKFPGCGWKP